MFKNLFNKGLGCPVGSVIVGTNELIRKAIRLRKVLGIHFSTFIFLSNMLHKVVSLFLSVAKDLVNR